MHSPDHMQAARVAMLEAALLAFFVNALQQGYDGVSITCTQGEDAPDIDVQYTAKGMPVAGFSL